MTSKYTEQHYEDVARLLKGRVSTAAPLNWVGHIAEVETNATVKRIANDFADLFAADNPNRTYCGYCGKPKNVEVTTCWQGDAGPGPHSWYEHKGFNRAQFLEACGLEV